MASTSISPAPAPATGKSFFNTNNTTSNRPCPQSTQDPRFLAARKLLVSGQSEEAVEIFAALLEQAVAAYGESHVEAAALYHEYGNALFRAYQRQRAMEEEEKEEIEQPDAKVNIEARRSAAAAAAEKRMPQQSLPSNKTASEPHSDANASSSVTDNRKDDNETIAANAPAPYSENDDSSDASSDDLELALEMIETAYAIYDQSIISGVVDSSSSNNSYRDWMEQEQLPRILVHLGEVLVESHRPADAIDAYLRALKYQQDLLQGLTVRETATASESSSPASSDSSLQLEILQCRRKLTETNVLIAETMLAAADDAALVTTETKTELVPAGQHVSYAKGYYDAAQSQLEEAVFFMGKLAGKSVDLGEEKENVCFASTLLMSVGLTLNERTDLRHGESGEPATKKLKK